MMESSMAKQQPGVALSRIAAVVDLNLHDFTNWRKRELLRTHYRDTINGKAREFTRENAIELAVVSALGKNGVAIPSAVAYADMVLRNARTGRLREYLMFPTGSVDSATGTDEPSAKLADLVAQAAGANIMSVSVVCVGEIVRRIDALFAEVDADCLQP
jgi:hypothetical protein